MGEPRVRTLHERDIDVAIALTNLEEWGYTRADFERLLALSPEGCFAVEDDGRVIGLLTTTSYGGLAFLGAVIVHPEYRGRGIGKLLMDAALEHLAGTGVETVRLNAYLNVIPFYERLGFRREYEVVRWRGPATSPQSENVHRARRRELRSVIAFDAPYFGADRGILLTRLFEENPDTFLVAGRHDRVLGYIIGNLFDHSCEIGPWVVAPGHPDVAPDLFRNLVALAQSREYAFSGPSLNPELATFVRGVGFQEVFRTLRMWWGKDLYPGDARGVWAAAGLEKG